MDTPLHLKLLGRPEINLGDVPLADRLPTKSQALLYYLAVTAQPQPRSTVATLLWGDLAEHAARANLRKALLRLRPSLEGYLTLDRHSLALKLDHDAMWVDVVAFETHLAEATPTLELGSLQRAVDLYRGDFLQGFYVRRAPDFEAWQLAEQNRLREQVIQALYRLSDLYREQDQIGQSINAARRLLSLEPWREGAHRQLILLLARTGQRSAALAQFEACRQVLADELSVEPQRRNASSG